MANITEQNMDISSYFNKPEGTVIYTATIEEEGLPRTAVVIDHKQKGIYFYEHKEGEITISLTPISDEETLEKLHAIVAEVQEREKREA